MEGRVHSTPPFMMFARNEHGEMPHENTRTKREPVLSHRQKKKKNCGSVRLHKACPQADPASTQTQKVRNHNSRIAEATELDWFCQMWHVRPCGFGG